MAEPSKRRKRGGNRSTRRKPLATSYNPRRLVGSPPVHFLSHWYDLSWKTVEGEWGGVEGAEWGGGECRGRRGMGGGGGEVFSSHALKAQALALDHRAGIRWSTVRAVTEFRIERKPRCCWSQAVNHSLEVGEGGEGGGL